MKKLTAILTVIIITLLCCTGVLAYTLFLSCNCTFTVIPSAKIIKFYNNAECTDPFINPHVLDFTTIEQGQVKSIKWYLKNEGLAATNLNVTVTGNYTTGGTVTFSPSGFPKLMQPGEVYQLTMFVSPGVTAPIGNYDFKVEFSD